MQQPSIIKEKHSLKRLNSWRVGGEAQFFAEPQSIDELKELCLWSSFFKVNVHILADGTNLLVSDKPLKALVLSLKKLRTSADVIQNLEGKAVTKDLSFSLLAGTPKQALFSICLKHNLPASIFLVGLPGSVGGGVVMNAGVGFDTFPREFNDIVDWVEVLSFNKNLNTFNLTRYSNQDLLWGYRFCKNWKSKNSSTIDIITEVGFSFPKEEFNKTVQKNQIILQKVKEAQVFRKTKQPINAFNCGSVFKNPKNYSAGALIDSSGLKLFSIGGASVSALHANFIVAEKGTKAQDIFNLIQKIQITVLEKKNIYLDLEVKLMGDFI